MPQFNVFQTVCSLLIWLLRPFSVMLEMLCHEEVGERYPGFGSFAALLIAEIWCLFSDDTFALHALMLAFAGRLIVHRVLAIRRRLGGGKYIHGRYSGRPLIARVIPQLPEQLLNWLEPIALILVSAVMCLLSASLGSYLLCGSIGWVIINGLRALAAYNRVLDRYDADPQAAELPMAGRYFDVLPPKPTIEAYDFARPNEGVVLPMPASTLAAIPQA